MRPSAFIRAFSVRIPASCRFSSSPVAPFPLPSAFHRWLRTELAVLRRSTTHPHQSPSYTSAAWISQALDVAIAAQKTTAESIARARGKAAVDDASLEDVFELLDACNCLRERMEAVRKYLESMRVAAHCLSAGGCGPNEAAFARAEAALGACEAMEQRRAELEKCGSSLRKLGEKLAQDREDVGADAGELDEALSGSKAMALLACGLLSTALSFKSKRGLPTATQCRGGQCGSWSSLLHELHKELKEEMDKRRKNGGVVLDELRAVVEAAQKLKVLIPRQPENEMWKREIRAMVGELERNCSELEGGIKVFEEKLNELYREMISIRVALLGLVSASESEMGE
ncbi:hypothetical protein ACLOJK_016914 [Asimina triloba]